MNELMVHLRVNGQTTEVPASELDVGQTSPDQTVFAAVAQYLGIAPSALDGYVIVRETTTMIVRPMAVYG